MKDSFFLEHELLPEDIEAAYRICMELQKEGKLEVKIDRKNKFVRWELKENG